MASRNGPPEAVRMSAATSPWTSPTRHCQIAECSESIGRSQASGLAYGLPGSTAARRAARRRATGMTRWPPATRVSLLAVATTLPACSAAMTGRRLTTPPVPMTTRSTSSRVASATSASDPRTRSVPAGRSRPVSAASSLEGHRSRVAAGAACSPRSAAFEPAARATTRNAAGCPASTSTAWRPIDPVDPSRATRRGSLAGASR